MIVNSQARTEAGWDQGALDEAAREGFACGAFEESEEDGFAVLEEFYPESEGTDPPDASSAISPVAEGRAENSVGAAAKRGLRDRLITKINGLAAAPAA